MSVSSSECPRCHGDGRAPSPRRAGKMIICPDCQGSGLHPKVADASDVFEDVDIPTFLRRHGRGPKFHPVDMVRCESCHGYGRVGVPALGPFASQDCPNCQGTGRVKAKRQQG